MARAVEIRGLDKVLKNMDKLGARVRAETKDVVTEAAERVVARARELAPVGRTGRLRDSIRVEGILDKDGRIVAEVRAGGDGIDYAAVVHEQHATKSKFIQKPALEVGRELPAALRRAWLREIDGKKL